MYTGHCECSAIATYTVPSITLYCIEVHTVYVAKLPVVSSHSLGDLPNTQL